MMELYQRYMLKLINIAEIKDGFVDDTEWFAARVQASISFATDSDHVLQQLVDIQKTPSKYWLKYLNHWEKLCKKSD